MREKQKQKQNKTKTRRVDVQQNYTEKCVYGVIIVHETPPCCTHHIQDQRVYAATLTCEHPATYSGLFSPQGIKRGPVASEQQN